MVFLLQTASEHYGLYIIQTFVALALIALLAWILIKFVAPRLSCSVQQSKMKVLERLTLEPKRSIYLVEVENQIFLIGSSETSVNFLKKIKLSNNEQAPSEQLLSEQAND